MKRPVVEHRAASKRDRIFVPFVLASYVALLYAIAFAPVWLAPILGVALSFFGLQLVMIAHDGMHGSTCFSRRTEHVIGWFLAIVSVAPYAYLREAHLRHHRLVGRPDDPEVLHFTRQEAAHRMTARLLSRLTWAGPVFFPLIQAIGFVRSVTLRPVIVVAFAQLTASIVFWLLMPTQLLVCGLLVSFCVGMGISHVASLPLHYHLMRNDAGLSADQRLFVAARSFDSNRVFRFVMGNSSYHVEHHLWPWLDRWRLAEVAVSHRSQIAAYAQSLGVPYLRHASYLRFYRELKRTRFNDIRTVEQLVEAQPT